MRGNEPVLLVLSVCDGKIILEKGEILYEKCHIPYFVAIRHIWIRGGAIAQAIHRGWGTREFDANYFNELMSTLEGWVNGHCFLDN
jgi:hypothetical protein